MLRKKAIWIYWVIMTLGITVYLVVKLTGEDKEVFLPGKTSHGHYQIEMACSVCHTDSFSGSDVLQDACMNCHGDELKQADDKHPKSKFTDPRNAARTEKLDARICIACHVEHKPEITHTMGVTQPDDFCFKCHSDIAEDRPSHTGMAFNTCTDAGCHNFHDDRALYEDFIAKHMDEPATLPESNKPQRSILSDYVSMDTYPLKKYPVIALAKSDIDAPTVINDEKIVQEWLMTSHSAAGVNCRGCHQKEDKSGNVTWLDKPGHDVCAICHAAEDKGFLNGKHGMRLAQKLSPMTPSMARIPMKKTAVEKELNCVTCHSAHKFDTRVAEIEACLGCHDDEHSRNYKNSKHYALWKTEGVSGKNDGVSCATCHMPRESHKANQKQMTIVQHNQNNNLRPNEKMIRDVCMACHGYGFSVDALASQDVIRMNFSTKPVESVKSIELVRERIRQNANRQKSK